MVGQSVCIPPQVRKQRANSVEPAFQVRRLPVRHAQSMV
jgi:hypothetical protein